MPTDFHPDFFNYYGVDGAGNIYYTPYFTPPLLRPARHTNAMGPRINTSITIERFTPTTGNVVASTLTGLSGVIGLAVDPKGNVDVVGYDVTLGHLVIERLNAGGGQVLLNSSIPNPEAIATDAAGNVFVSSNSGTTSIFEIPAGGGSASLVASAIPDAVWSLAVAPSGSIYAVSPLGGDVFGISPGGVVTFLPSLSGEASNVAVDAAGNVFVAEPSSRLVVEQTAVGNLEALPIAPSGATISAPVLLAFGGASIFMWDNATRGDLYTWATSGSARPTLTSVTSTATRMGTRYFQSVTATWTGSGTAFRCTLMYGFNSPTNFTQRTSTRSCTFSNLDLGRSYGISVVALAGSAASAPAVGFAPAPRVTLTCVRHGVTRHVSGLNPRCMPGWRQI